MNRPAVYLSAFALLIAVGAGLIAASIYRGMQASIYQGVHAMNVAEAACVRGLGGARPNYAFDKRYVRCMKSKGVLVTTTITKHVPAPGGFSISTKIYVKDARAQSSSDAPTSHT